MTVLQPLEKLGQALVEDVCDGHINQMLDIIAGESRTIDGRSIFEKLAKVGIGSQQYAALRELLIFATDGLIGRALAFAEYQITMKSLQVGVAEKESGESYLIDEFDMLGAAYCGPGGCVEQYSQIKA